LDLVADRINASIIEPQTTLAGQQYMTKDLTHEVIQKAPQHGSGSEGIPILAVFDFVKQNVQYRQDPRDYDYYMSVGRILNSGAGDCDDMTIINCAMLSSVGYLVGGRVISPDGYGWHIYCIVGINPAFNGSPQGLVALDTAYGDKVGWEPGMYYRRYEKQCTFRNGKVVGLTTVRAG